MTESLASNLDAPRCIELNRCALYLHAVKSQRIFLTGASSGIGAATARLLAEKGHRVLLISRDLSAMKSWASTCDENSVLLHEGDVTDAKAMELAAQKVIDHWGGIDVFIPNAGIGVFSPLEEANISDWHRMIDVNIKGVLNGVHACLDSLLKNKGQVIQIGSVAARNVFPNSGVYCATKHAVLALSESLRIEFRDRLAVTTINPGAVNTAFIDQTTNSELRESYRPQFEKGMDPTFIAEAILLAIESKGRGVFSEITVRPDNR
jgi:NADP-dependent 3-hydroxy acid dehydrogenase YdfG